MRKMRRMRERIGSEAQGEYLGRVCGMAGVALNVPGDKNRFSINADAFQRDCHACIFSDGAKKEHIKHSKQNSRRR